MAKYIKKLTKTPADAPWVLATPGEIRNWYTEQEIAEVFQPHIDFMNALEGYLGEEETIEGNVLTITHNFATAENMRQALTALYGEQAQPVSIARNQKIIDKSKEHGVTYTVEVSFEY